MNFYYIETKPIMLLKNNIDYWVCKKIPKDNFIDYLQDFNLKVLTIYNNIKGFYSTLGDNLNNHLIIFGVNFEKSIKYNKIILNITTDLEKVELLNIIHYDIYNKTYVKKINNFIPYKHPNMVKIKKYKNVYKINLMSYND